MKKIIFVCHGNICRSPMAEFVMKDLVQKAGRKWEFQIDSAAVSTEELGNDVYPNTKKLLYQKGVPVYKHAAHQITKAEFDEYDYIIIMDQSNLSLMVRLVGEERVYNTDKVHLLMEFAEGASAKDKFSYPSVADPWYTRDFERSYKDILAGCKGLLEKLS